MHDLFIPFLIFFNTKKYVTKLNHRIFIPAGILISISTPFIHTSEMNTDLSIFIIAALMTVLFSTMTTGMISVLVKGILLELKKVNIPFVSLVNLIFYSQLPLLVITIIFKLFNAELIWNLTCNSLFLASFLYAISLFIYGIIILFNKYKLNHEGV
jgi:branched-subunit amino acid transport protein